MPAKAVKSRSLYSVHPGVRMVQDWVASLREKTGRSLDEWIDLTKNKGPRSVKDRREWLKAEHGMGTNAAWWIAERADGKGVEEDTAEGYLEAAERHVEGQYSGKRSALRPLYDRLLAIGLSAGADVKACPCKTMVPLYRNHVFAQIKATTTARIDLGLALGSMPASKIPKRLIDTGGKAKKDRITHRIEIQGASDIDDTVMKWLKAAYDLDSIETPSRSPKFR
ncbi:MAG: DUF4287 domain-containing protein [Phycisphaeraceae bacterium]|nr:DUF4287 domain-containing protein [Phycisphaeraceae bacterium]